MFLAHVKCDIWLLFLKSAPIFMYDNIIKAFFLILAKTWTQLL